MILFILLMTIGDQHAHIPDFRTVTECRIVGELWKVKASQSHPGKFVTFYCSGQFPGFNGTV
jgi:hypothetical protein